MIIDQFHRHRRQCSIAAVPLGPTTPVGICCGPTFVSEPDWFRCHGSDLLERILQIFVCWQKRFTFRNHSRAKIGEIGWRYFLPWLRQGVVCVWFWAPDEFGRHRSDVTGPVTWLQQLVRLAAQQIGNSQSEKCKVADLGSWRCWQGGLGWGDWREEVSTNKICSEKVFRSLSQHFTSHLKYDSTIKCSKSRLNKKMSLKRQEIWKIIVSDFCWRVFGGHSNGIE